MFLALAVLGAVVFVAHRGAANPPVAVTPPVRQAPAGASPSASAIGAERILAIGSPTLPSSGASAGLTASTRADAITISSDSAIPVSVSLSDGLGAPLRAWTTLTAGQSEPQRLVTGRSYGYCFTQPAGSGYGASRGCGTLVMHRFVNGVEVPDGDAIAVTVAFRGR